MAHVHELIDFTVSVYIVHKNKVLLIKHIQLNIWLPVGGHVELNEDTDEALTREIKEECGLNVKIFGKITKKMASGSKPLRVPQFMEIHKINDKHKHLDMIYFAYAKNNKAKLLEKRHHELKWFEITNLNDKKISLLPTVKFYATEALKLLEKK